MSSNMDAGLNAWVQIRELTRQVPSTAGAQLAGLLLNEQAAETNPANAFVAVLSVDWRTELARALGYLGQ